MRPKTRRIALASALVIAASLTALHPLDPLTDPAWWLLGGLRKAAPAPKGVLILDAPPGTTLSPGELALDLRELAEFGSGDVVIDLPVDWAAGDTTPVDTLARLRTSIDLELTGIDKDLKNFWLGLRTGSLRASDAASGFSALEDLVSASRQRLLATARPDSAELPSLEGALGVKSDVWLCIGLKALPEAPSDAETAWMSSLARHGPTTSMEEATTHPNWRLPKIAGLALPPPELISSVAGLGFSLRDESLSGASKVLSIAYFTPLASYEDKIILHPALPILAKRLGASRIELTPSGIRLVGARSLSIASIHEPGSAIASERSDLLIPLDRDGRALFAQASHEVAWPPRLSISALEDYRGAESRVIEALAFLEKAGLLVDRKDPIDLWRQASALGEALVSTETTVSKQASSPVLALAPDSTLPPLTGPEQPQSSFTAASPLAGWLSAKAAFFDAAQAALGERAKMDELLSGLLSTPGMASDARNGVVSLREKADKAFDALASSLDDWRLAKARLSDSLAGSLVIVGNAPYRSRGGFVPAGGATPVDPSGEMAAFIRAGSYDSFIAVAEPSAILPIALLVGLALIAILVLLGPRLALAAGLFVALAGLAFSGLALVQAGTWWSPTVPLAVAFLPGLGGLAVELAEKLEEVRARSGEEA